MGKQQLLSFSPLSPEVTAEFSSGVDLPTTVLVLDRELGFVLCSNRYADDELYRPEHPFIQ
jgi:hypothetical protein